MALQIASGCVSAVGRFLVGTLHDDTAAAGLLGRVGVLALGDGSPDRRHHVVSRAVAVGNDAIPMSAPCQGWAGARARRLSLPPRSGAHGDALALQILAQTVVKLG